VARRARRRAVTGLLAIALVSVVVSIIVATTAQAQLQLTTTVGPANGNTHTPGAPPKPSSQSLAIGLVTLRFVDRSRTIQLGHGRSEPRTLLTYVRYPALGAPGVTDVPNAAPAAGPHPLIVFGHGFAVTPKLYARLLASWARAGYVVAAPVFPLSNADAPDGPEEADLVNQPSDVSFVISRLLALSGQHTGPLAGLIDPKRIAVAGHSDGAETALAVAYSRRFHDPRVGAAVILSGAEMSGIGGYDFTAGKIPLLAVQGTADTFNEPRYTYAYFDLAPRPKFLLRLLGAGHLPPYSYQQPQLKIVERTTIAFLDRYIEGEKTPLQRLTSLGDVSSISELVADP
jgi:dienelactone hydrolase